MMHQPPVTLPARTNGSHEQPPKARPVPVPWAGLVRRLLGLHPGRYVIVLHVEDGGPATWQIGAIGPDERARQ
jgi:hypothetical protein